MSQDAVVCPMCAKTIPVTGGMEGSSEKGVGTNKPADLAKIETIKAHYASAHGPLPMRLP